MRLTSYLMNMKMRYLLLVLLISAFSCATALAEVFVLRNHRLLYAGAP